MQQRSGPKIRRGKGNYIACRKEKKAKIRGSFVTFALLKGEEAMWSGGQEHDGRLSASTFGWCQRIWRRLSVCEEKIGAIRRRINTTLAKCWEGGKWRWASCKSNRLDRRIDHGTREKFIRRQLTAYNGWLPGKADLAATLNVEMSRKTSAVVNSQKQPNSWTQVARKCRRHKEYLLPITLHLCLVDPLQRFIHYYIKNHD